MARRPRTRSVALESYWSRGAIRWGDHAVRYLLRPASNAPGAPDPPRKDPEYLSKEAALRLAAGDIEFELCLQLYVDERATPIEDTAIKWSETKAPEVCVARLRIPSADAGTAAAREFQAHMAGRAAVACVVTAMFTWFGLTSFWRASRRSREASR